jgi:hypothetical protein
MLSLTPLTEKKATNIDRTKKQRIDAKNEAKKI